jgi:hypothetical protein
MASNRACTTAVLAVISPGRLIRSALLYLAVLATGLVGLAAPSTVRASHTPDGLPRGEDFVTGEYSVFAGCGTTTCPVLFFTFDAHSDPGGQNPRGTVRLDVESVPPGIPIPRRVFATYRVTCLSVAGNRATVEGVNVDSSDPNRLTWFIQDGGANQPDRASQSLNTPIPCPEFPATLPPPISGGTLIVHDAPDVPTSAAQCKNGGWKQFGYKNQGRCIKFVKRARNR